MSEKKEDLAKKIREIVSKNPKFKEELLKSKQKTEQKKETVEEKPEFFDAKKLETAGKEKTFSNLKKYYKEEYAKTPETTAPVEEKAEEKPEIKVEIEKEKEEPVKEAEKIEEPVEKKVVEPTKETEKKVVKDYYQKKLAETAQKKAELQKEKGALEKPEATTKTSEEEKEAKEEIPLETKLNEARENYAAGYKQFMAERKQKSNFVVNLGRKIFGSKVREEKIPENIKDLEKNYDKFATEYGKKMYADKKAELEKSNKTPEEQAEELAQFKQKEIFNKVILEEQEKLNALKAENLPPKEKNVLKKSIDWYLKQNKVTKIAISTALSAPIIITFLPGTVAAAGGVGAFLATKYARGLVGSIFGQLAAKGYEKIVKEKYTERKEKALEELQKKFGENMANKEVSEYKKQYAEILEKEKTSKRNRIIHKAIVAITVGGAAGYGTGVAAHYLSPEQVLSGEVPHRTSISEHLKGRGVIDHAKGGGGGTEQIIKPEEVNYSSRGAIQTIEELKEKISKDYPDITKAPASMQDFMKTDSTQEAIKLGMYNPNAPAESMIVQKGTLSWDENGNLKTHYIDMKRVEHDQVLVKGGTVEQYKGDMFSSDKNAASASTTGTTGATTPDQTPSGHTISDKIIAPKPVASGDIHTVQDTIVAPKPVGQTVEQTETTAGNTAKVASETKISATEHPGPTATETNAKVETGSSAQPTVTPEEILTKVNQEYENTIGHVFPNKESLALWANIKDSHGLASTILQMPEVAESYQPLQKVMQQLYELTGIKPTEATAITLGDSPAEYIKNTIQYAEENNIDLTNLEY